MPNRRSLREQDYARLLAVRTRLREFEHWSGQRAAEHGLTSSQHQLLLAVRGHGDAVGPTIGEIAEYLMVRHNTAVELVTRTQELGLLDRVRDADDHRVVRLTLTARARRRLADLSQAHIEELARLTPMLESMISDLAGTDGASGATRT